MVYIAISRDMSLSFHSRVFHCHNIHTHSTQHTEPQSQWQRSDDNIVSGWDLIKFSYWFPFISFYSSFFFYFPAQICISIPSSIVSISVLLLSIALFLPLFISVISARLLSICTIYMGTVDGPTMRCSGCMRRVTVLFVREAFYVETCVAVNRKTVVKIKSIRIHKYFMSLRKVSSMVYVTVGHWPDRTGRTYSMCMRIVYAWDVTLNMFNWKMKRNKFLLRLCSAPVSAVATYAAHISSDRHTLICPEFR